MLYINPPYHDGIMYILDKVNFFLRSHMVLNTVCDTIYSSQLLSKTDCTIAMLSEGYSGTEIRREDKTGR